MKYSAREVSAPKIFSLFRYQFELQASEKDGSH